MSRIWLFALAAALAVTARAGVSFGEDVHVTQKGKSFLPGKVNLEVGDKVVFHNEDPITHNMFSRSEGHAFNLKMQKPGQDLEQEFDEPGTAVVRCAIHPKMKLIVKVEEKALDGAPAKVEE